MKVNYFSALFRSGLVIIPIIILSACSNNPVQDTKSLPELPNDQPETFVYQCDDYRFTARIEGEQVWLFLPGETINLPHVASGSGAKYSDGEAMFWNKGEEAMLTLGSVKHRNCVNNRKKAIWEHAKLNGVDFRAVGNEPGWHLELTQGKQIVLVTDYGQSRYIFSTPDPETDRQARKISYNARQDGNQLWVIIEDRTCHDTMSDEVFASRVKVKINQKSYQGCGAALH